MQGNERRSSLAPVLLGAVIVGEAAFVGMYRLRPTLPEFVALIVLCFVVKVAADLASMLLEPGVHEFAYIDDYMVNELFTWSFYALPITVLQTLIVLYFERGSLLWYATGSAIIPAMVYAVLRRKRERELEQTHKLGQRVRGKYGIQ